MTLDKVSARRRKGTLVSLYDQQWEMVRVYDEDLVGADSMLEFKCEESGIYYIKIYADPIHFGGDTYLGDYLVEVRHLD